MPLRSKMLINTLKVEERKRYAMKSSLRYNVYIQNGRYRLKELIIE